MVNITISLTEQTVRRLRRAVRERYGGRKGALSGFIKDAIDEHLEALQTEAPHTFRATEKGRLVAEGSSLEELASKLKELGVDPRSVRIVSSASISPVARAGFRARHHEPDPRFHPTVAVSLQNSMLWRVYPTEGAALAVIESGYEGFVTVPRKVFRAVGWMRSNLRAELWYSPMVIPSHLKPPTLPSDSLMSPSGLTGLSRATKA